MAVEVIPPPQKKIILVEVRPQNWQGGKIDKEIKMY